MISLALASGGLAASQVRQRTQEVERQVGPGAEILVAARDLPAQSRLRSRDLALREVPESFVPRDALRAVEEAAGLRIATPVAKGGYLTAGHVRTTERAGRGGGLRRGERAVELAVAGGEALAGSSSPGSRVDVVVSSESRDGAGRTFLALEDVELLGLRSTGASASPPGDGGDSEPGAAAKASAVATLRVTLRQAVYLTAAENFAREVRLLPRPAGDGRRAGRAAVTAAEL